ncbi:MAG: ABC transporter permease [Bacteroidota bacterium]|nr:ABC transporter permease [Bacteroidota bacterium]
MKEFLSFVKKEFFHIWRDRQTLLILLGMPLVLILIFGFALTTEVKNSKFAVLDFSNDGATREIINDLNASRYFDLTANLHTNEDIESIFHQGKARVIIVFPALFESELQRFNTAQVQLLVDASDPNVATSLTGYASNIIMDYQKKLTREKKIPYTILTRVHMLYNPRLRGTFTFVPGVISMILMLVCTLMTSITVVREKETGAMEVLLVSSLKPAKIIFSKAIPYFFISIINIVSILMLSVFVLDVPIRGSLVLLLSESILFTTTCLSLGLLISTATGSQIMAMFISLVGLFLPTVMLSGFLFPIENMPWILRAIAQLIPSKWYYDIVRSVMIKGLPFSAVWKETLILAGMTILLLWGSLRNLKIRLA